NARNVHTSANAEAFQHRQLVSASAHGQIKRTSHIYGEAPPAILQRKSGKLYSALHAAAGCRVSTQFLIPFRHLDPQRLRRPAIRRESTELKIKHEFFLARTENKLHVFGVVNCQRNDVVGSLVTYSN